MTTNCMFVSPTTWKTRSYTLVYTQKHCEQSGGQMEAWIACERNRKFSETLETLLLFLRMFHSVAGSVEASLH